jgi:transcription elongation factor Elf1
MSKSCKRYGICGVYCGQCPNGNGRVRMMAGELKRLVDTTRYDWVKDAVKSFSFDEFRKGLEWFSDSQCPMCLNGGGAPCKNRECATKKGFQSCLLCGDYLTCKNTEYQRDVYPFVVENYARVKQVGFEKHLEEEDERARAGVDLMGHLERRYCKVIKLEDKDKAHA